MAFECRLEDIDKSENCLSCHTHDALQGFSAFTRRPLPSLNLDLRVSSYSCSLLACMPAIMLHTCCLSNVYIGCFPAILGMKNILAETSLQDDSLPGCNHCHLRLALSETVLAFGLQFCFHNGWPHSGYCQTLQTGSWSCPTTSLLP